MSAILKALERVQRERGDGAEPELPPAYGFEAPVEVASRSRAIWAGAGLALVGVGLAAGAVLFGSRSLPGPAPGAGPEPVPGLVARDAGPPAGGPPPVARQKPPARGALPRVPVPAETPLPPVDVAEARTGDAPPDAALHARPMGHTPLGAAPPARSNQRAAAGPPERVARTPRRPLPSALGVGPAPSPPAPPAAQAPAAAAAPVRTTSLAAVPAPPQPATPSEPAPGAAAPSRPGPPASALTAAPGSPTAAEVPAAQELARVSQPAAAARPRPSTAEPAAATAKPAPATPKPATRTSSAATPKPATRTSSAATPKPASSAPAPKPPAPASKPLPKVGVVAATPELHIERTVWHPSPERREATVRLPDRDDPLELREGDAVGRLVVAEIQPSGVVFVQDGVELRRAVGE